MRINLKILIFSLTAAHCLFSISFIIINHSLLIFDIDDNYFPYHCENYPRCGLLLNDDSINSFNHISNDKWPNIIMLTVRIKMITIKKWTIFLFILFLLYYMTKGWCTIQHHILLFNDNMIHNNYEN